MGQHGMLQVNSANRSQSPGIRLKMNISQCFPWQLSIQPISEGWIGLDAEAHRADIPIRQVLKSITQKSKKLQISSPSTHPPQIHSKRHANAA